MRATLRKIRDSWLLVGTGVLLIIGLTVAGWTGLSAWHEHQTEQARTDSLVVARRTLQGMFGYSYQSVEQQMAKVTDDMTPDMRDDWNKVTKEVILPGAKDQQLQVTATIEGTGVVSAGPSHVEALIFLNQKSVGKDPAKGTYDQSKVRVKLDKRDGRWLVSDVTPV